MIGFLNPKTDSVFFSNRVIQDPLDPHGASKEPNNPLKKWAWNWYSSRPLLNKLAVHGWSNGTSASFSDFRLLPVNFRILSLFLHVSGLKNSRAKFVFFSSFIQTWNNYLFIFYRESRSLSLRRNVVILCVYITHAHRTDQARHSLCNKTVISTEPGNKNSAEHIRMLFVAQRSNFWKLF